MPEHKKKAPFVVNFYAKVGTPELLFFIGLMLMFFVPFIFPKLNEIVISILFSIYVFAVQYFVVASEAKYPRQLNLFIAFLLLLYWLKSLGIVQSSLFHFIAEFTILLISFYFVFKSVFSNKDADINTLFASISGYILLGIMFGISTYLYQEAFPDSYKAISMENKHDSFYYAFTTMSTLGYGDVVPLSTGAKGLAILITLTGQFYIVIIMGIIVGKVLKPNQKT